MLREGSDHCLDPMPADETREPVGISGQRGEHLLHGGDCGPQVRIEDAFDGAAPRLEDARGGLPTGA
jgi:hypothetical protein